MGRYNQLTLGMDFNHTGKCSTSSINLLYSYINHVTLVFIIQLKATIQKDSGFLVVSL
jgi:hypothetical protein